MKSVTDQIKAERMKAESQRYHIKFRTMWRAIEGPAIAEEFAFSDKRRWRFDFAHRPSMVAIEIEGGVWSGGRHTSGSGFTKDCEKYNQAALMGWAVFRLTPNQITFTNLETFAQFMRDRSHKMADAYEAAS